MGETASQGPSTYFVGLLSAAKTLLLLDSLNFCCRNELYSGIVDMHAQLHHQEMEVKRLRTEEKMLGRMLKDKKKQSEVRSEDGRARSKAKRGARADRGVISSDERSDSQKEEGVAHKVGLRR